jgi:thiamine biosynthesis protein ThiS
LNLRINGEGREVADNLSLQELVTQLDLTPERIAIELNQNVVRRADWSSTLLTENDRVEIVHFVGGGSAVGRSSRQEDTIHKITPTEPRAVATGC